MLESLGRDCMADKGFRDTTDPLKGVRILSVQVNRAFFLGFPVISETPLCKKSSKLIL